MSVPPPREFRAEVQPAVNTVREQLREQIHSASVRTQTLMRVLHEEALSRIATIGEGRRIKRKK